METLPFSPGRLLWFGAPLSALIVVSYLLNPAAWRHAQWWVYAVLGAFFALVLVGPLVLKRRASLGVDREGIHVRMLLRSTTYRWADIEGFTTGSLEHGPVPVARFVGILLRGKENGPLRRINGYDRSLPAWFGGLNAVELRDYLEQRRRRHGS